MSFHSYAFFIMHLAHSLHEELEYRETRCIFIDVQIIVAFKTTSTTTGKFTSKNSRIQFERGIACEHRNIDIARVSWRKTRVLCVFTQVYIRTRIQTHTREKS